LVFLSGIGIIYCVDLGEGYTGRFIMLSLITNIHNMKTEGPTLMELFTATRKMVTRVWQQLEYRVDVCHVTRGAHIEHL
jgi:hypothetical protein